LETQVPAEDILPLWRTKIGCCCIGAYSWIMFFQAVVEENYELPDFELVAIIENAIGS
jgi:hypothetical protein